MSWTATARSSSPEATRRLAAALATIVRRGDVVVLAGRLGAGKTTWVQGFAEALGVVGPVTSPTFTLVRQYRCAIGELVHADLYRLDQTAEVVDLGIDELAEEGVAVIEWGDVATPALGVVNWTVSIEADGEEERTVTVRGDDDRGPAASAALAGAMAAG